MTTTRDNFYYALQSMRKSRRRGTALQGVGCIRDAMNTLHERASQRIDKASDMQGIPTAAWRWYADRHGRPAHQFLLCRDYVDTITVVDAKTSHRLRLAYGYELLRHESAHARWTHRDNLAIQGELARRLIPFALFNLFEDARIEHLERDARGPFGWTRFFLLRDGNDHPTRQFFYHVTAESESIARRVTWTGAPTVKFRGDGKKRVTPDLIAEFYTRACNAASTMALLDVCEDWVRTFPGSGSDVPTDGSVPTVVAVLPGTVNGGGGVPSPSTPPTPAAPPPLARPGVGPSDNDGGRLQNVPTSYDDKYNAPDTPTLTEAEDTALSFYSIVKSPGGYNVNNTEGRLTAAADNTDMKLDQVRPIMARLRQFVSARDGVRQRVSVGGSRLHMRNVIVGEPASFRRSLQRGGKRKVVLVMDMSGSMVHAFNEHGAAFLMAMLSLHRQGVVDVEAYCTGQGKCARVPAHISRGEFRKLCASKGRESVAQTLNTIRRSVLAADTTIIYTDGRIGDGVVNAGEWRAHGVDMIGVCTAPKGNVSAALRASMVQHFAHVLTAPTGHELAGLILQHVLRHS